MGALAPEGNNGLRLAPYAMDSLFSVTASQLSAYVASSANKAQAITSTIRVGLLGASGYKLLAWFL